MGLWGNINGFGVLVSHQRQFGESKEILWNRNEKDMTNPSFKLAYGVALLKSGEFESQECFQRCTSKQRV